MVIGTTKRHKFYIVRKEDEGGTWPASGPSSQSAFIDYSGRWLSWSVSGNISQVKFFKGVLAGGVNTDEIKKGNLLYVMSGTKLLGKFVIGRPTYMNNRTVEIKGFQSTGSEMQDKKLLTMSVAKHKFVQETQEDIFGDDTSGYGSDDSIFIDSEGDNIIKSVGMEGASDRFNFKIDYDNRILTTNKACRIMEKEWVVDHGDNNASPYSEGDSISIINRVGSSSSSYIFYITGVNKNCSFSTSNDESDSIVNDCILKGQDQNGMQVTSRVFDAADDVTYTSTTLDGWLYEDIGAGWDNIDITSWGPNPFEVGEVIEGQTSGATAFIVYEVAAGYYDVTDVTGTFSVGEAVEGKSSGENGTYHGWSSMGCTEIKVHKGNGFSGSVDFYVKIDSERLWIYNVDTSAADYDVLNLYGKYRGNPTFGRGKDYVGTLSTQHNANSDVINLGRATGSRVMLVHVDSTSGFATSGLRNIKVGSETMYYVAEGSDFFIVESRSFNDSYAHGESIRVSQYHAAGDTYTSDAPEHGTNSCYINGPQVKCLSEVANVARDELDRKAQNIIENRGEVQRIALSVGDYFDVWDTIDIGDTVTLSDTDPLNISAGSYRIMGFEYFFDHGRINLKLHLNDNLTRTWASTDFTYPDEADEADQPKRNEAVRNTDDNRFMASLGLGNEQKMILPAQYKNVTDPEDSYDAVNKKYVDQCTTGSVGTDEFVKITATDSTASHLMSKMVAGTDITLTQVGGAGAYQLIRVDYSGSPVTGYWARNALLGYLYPSSGGDDIYPSGPGSTLGGSGAEWDIVYTEHVRATNTVTARWSTYWASPSVHRISNQFAGWWTELEVEGNIVQYNGTGYTLGENGNYWAAVKAIDVDLQDRITWTNLASTYMSASAAFGIRLWDAGILMANFSNSSDILLNNDTDIDGGLTVTGNLQIDGGSTLGNAYGDWIYMNGGIGTTVIPAGDNIFSVGDASHRWGSVHAVDVSITGSLDLNGSDILDAGLIEGSIWDHLIIQAQTPYDIWMYGTDIELHATDDINLYAADDINLDATGNIDLDSTGYMDFFAFGDISFLTSTYFDLYAVDDVTIGSNRDIELVAEDDIWVKATDDIIITAGDDLDLGADDNVWVRWERASGDYSAVFSGDNFYPMDDCVIDLGQSSNSFQFIYGEYIKGALSGTHCDLAELQFVASDVEVGDIVEIGDWDSDEETYFLKELDRCQRKTKLKGHCDLNFYGMQGKWKRAGVNSRKCPSVVSTFPMIKMGTTELREDLYEKGRMNFIALSGSVPNVYIEGDFESGDILVSAGDGRAKVNNDAPWNQVLGHAKRTGKDERCEVWVK